MCPPPSPDPQDAEADEEMEESVEMETSSDREAFLARLNLLTNEGGKHIEEVLSGWIHVNFLLNTWFAGLQEKEAEAR